VVVGEGRHDAIDGPIEDDDYMRPKIALVTPEAAEVLHSAGEGSLGEYLRLNHDAMLRFLLCKIFVIVNSIIELLAFGCLDLEQFISACFTGICD